MQGHLSRRAGHGAEVIGLLLVSGCGREVPTAPRHTLAGQVVLVGYFTDASANFVGTRVDGHASGVPVELLASGFVVARTSTVNGRYTFPDLEGGSYVARTRITPELFDETVMVRVTDTDLWVLDTLRLRSRGDLYPYPNPFRTALTTMFAVPAREPGSLRVLDIGGSPVRTLIEGTFAPGPHTIAWDGMDARGAPAPAGLYWLVFSDEWGSRVQLVVRE